MVKDMTTKENPGTYFDATGYEDHCKKIAGHVERFAAAVEVLKKEGMDVSAKELRTWPERFGDFGENDGAKYKQHFVSLYKKAEERAGWLPIEERTRMFDNYIAVFRRTLSAAQDINNALIFGCIIKDTAESAAVDGEATKAEHKERFIIPIHAGKLAEHWDMLIAAKQAINALRDWETANGMPRTGEANDYNRFGYFINDVKLMDGSTVNISRAEHDRAVWGYFKKA